MCAKPGLDVILVHAHGVGVATFKGHLLNGDNGEAGKHGQDGNLLPCCHCNSSSP